MYRKEILMVQKHSVEDFRNELFIRLRGLREEEGVTQQELASRMKTTGSAISRLESGRRNPRLDTLALYANALGYDIEFVFEEVA